MSATPGLGHSPAYRWSARPLALPSSSEALALTARPSAARPAAAARKAAARSLVSQQDLGRIATASSQPSLTKPSGLTAAQITARISRTTSVAALELLVTQHHSQLNQIHISASIVHLQRLLQQGGAGDLSTASSTPLVASDDGEQQQEQEQEQREQLLEAEQLWGVLLQLARRHAHQFDAQAVGNVLHGLASRQHYEQQLVEALLSRAYAIFATFDPQALAQTCWALGRLQCRPSDAWARRLLRRVGELLPAFEQQHVALVLWGLAKSGARPQAHIVRRLLGAALHSLPSYSPQNLAMLLHSSALLGYCPPPEWMAAFYGASMAAMPVFDEQQLASVAWALGRMAEVARQLERQPAPLAAAVGAQAQQQVQQQEVQRLRQRPAPGEAQQEQQEQRRQRQGQQGQLRSGPGRPAQQLLLKPPQLWLQRFYILTEPKLARLGGQELCSMLAGLSWLRSSPPPSWLQQLHAFNEAKLLQLGPAASAAVLALHASLGVGPPAPWLRSFFSASYGGMRGYSHLELGSTAHSLAALGVRPGAAWADRLLAAAAQQLPQAAPASTASVVSAALQLALHQPQRQQQQVLVLLDGAVAQLAAYELPELLLLLRALAGSQPPVQLSALQQQLLLKACLRLHPACRPESTAALLHGLAVLRLQPPAGWLRQLCNQLTPRLAQFGGSEAAISLWALVRLGHQPDRAWVHALLDSAAAAGSASEAGRLCSCSCYSAQELSMVCWALGKLRFVPTQGWLAAFLGHTAGSMATYEPQTLAALVWMLARAAVVPGKVWQARFEEASAQQLPRCQPSELHSIVCSLAALRAQPGEAWLAAGERAAEQAAGQLAGPESERVHAALRTLGGGGRSGRAENSGGAAERSGSEESSSSSSRNGSNGKRAAATSNGNGSSNGAAAADGVASQQAGDGDQLHAEFDEAVRRLQQQGAGLGGAATEGGVVVMDEVVSELPRSNP